ncbi:MAG: DUF805 domain-containing protein [Caulobacteraceae bacterium]
MQGGQIDWTQLFFSSSGRLARTPFLVAAAVLIVVLAVYDAAAGVALHWLTGWVVYPVLIFCSACVLSKRLHDRGRSGWWAAVILIAFGAAWQSPRGYPGVVGCLVIVWTVVELGLLSGEQGANRFGPNPVRQMQRVEV